MKTATIPYTHEKTTLEAFVAYPQSTKQKLPTVILCHAWTGRDSFICEKAKLIAEWGYVGFALDMYGKGILGKTKEENAALKKPFLQNRNLLQSRLLAALETAHNLPYVDSTQIAVVGFGFGGLCALDFARSGANLKGVVSVYGHFEPPTSTKTQPIQTKLLILHGYNDPIVPSKEALAFTNELNANVDWQLQLYGNTMHAFTNPQANDPDSGILYRPLSAHRAWRAIQNFLSEIL